MGRNRLRSGGGVPPFFSWRRGGCGRGMPLVWETVQGVWVLQGDCFEKRMVKSCRVCYNGRKEGRRYGILFEQPGGLYAFSE